MTFPSFTTGEVLTAADMNAVGMWLVKTQTVGSAVTSVTVTSAFSSTYDNYRIVYDRVATSGTNSLNLTFGGSAGSTYNDAGYYIGIGTATITTETTLNRASIRIGIVETSSSISGWIDVFAPNISGRTWVNGGSMAPNFANWRQGVDTNTASHTAFTLTAAAGNMTGGTIRVYGYRN
jgi:hypothetical protein